ncbi:MAG TPA: carboxymuconolactone decarboxylase family protein [Xanthobacteraceae bacterium]|nr:carboxymuconolactone decarboxylase family protein [Xanthobacteraceae bacterium]
MPVARTAYPSLDNLSPRLQEELRKRIAPDRGNVWKMLMWSPEMAVPFIDFNDAVRYKLSISDELRELIILRVGRLCDAAYEIHHHTRIAREIGMSEHLIEATKIGSSAPGLDATQRLALDIADDLVKDRRVSDANFPRALEVFGPSVLNEIIMLAGCYVIACMFLRTYGIEIEKPIA